MGIALYGFEGYTVGYGHILRWMRSIFFYKSSMISFSCDKKVGHRLHKNEWIGFIIATIPIIWLLVSLGKWKMPAYRASLIALALTVVISFGYYSMPAVFILEASLEGVMLAVFPIIWVIISALFVYNTTLATGSMEKIKIMLSNLSPDRRIQGLILAFAFGGFLEAVAGFGTAVAIPAGILAAMGFSPMLAATICLIANTVPVAFGVLGVPVITLAQVTSLPLHTLTFYTAVQLIPFAVFLPFVLIFAITGSIRKIRGVGCISLFSGIIFALGQTITAYYAGPELAAVVGSLTTLLFIIIWIRLFPIKNIWRFEGENSKEVPFSVNIKIMDALKAWLPYIIILILIFTIKFLPMLHFLNQYPFVLTKQFYFGPSGKTMVFQLATSGGTILFVAALLGGLMQGAGIKMLWNVFRKTIKQIEKTIITIISIVALAKVMGYSGMVNSIAHTLANVSGRFYPLMAPFLGAMGTFITGSDTSSNVLFGNLQKQTALTLGLSPEWLTAANAAGATAGKMISPQSIAIAASSTDLTNQEGKILETTFSYCIVYVVMMGILVFVCSGVAKLLP